MRIYVDINGQPLSKHQQYLAAKSDAAYQRVAYLFRLVFNPWNFQRISARKLFRNNHGY